MFYALQYILLKKITTYFKLNKTDIFDVRSQQTPSKIMISKFSSLLSKQSNMLPLYHVYIFLELDTEISFAEKI